MKLHLPKKLRAALLAVVASAVAAPATTLAADGVAYDYTYFQHATQVHANLRENSLTYDDPSGENANGIAGNYNFRDPLGYDENDNVFNSKENDWTLTIDAYNFLPAKDVDNDETIGALLFSTGNMVNDGDTKVLKLTGANKFGIMLDRNGTVYLSTTDKDGNVSRKKALFSLEESWTLDGRDDNTQVSLRLTFSWDADGGLPNFQKGGNYGALTLQSAYVLSNDKAHTVVKEIHSYYTGATVLDNYVMPETLFSKDDGEAGDAFSMSGKGGTASVTLMSPGASPAWCVTGDAGIKTLLEGGYKDNTIGGDTRKIQDGERVQFIGNKGALWLTSGEYTYDITTWATADPEGRSAEAGVGFGANEGATLTVAENVVNSTIIGTGASVSALGSGTVRFVVNTNNIDEIELPEIITLPEEEEEIGNNGNQPPADDEAADDAVVGDDTEIEDDEFAEFEDEELAGDGEGEVDGPDLDYHPAAAAGTRTLALNMLGARTNVELEVLGSHDVAVVLGSATIGNEDDKEYTNRITRLKQQADEEGNISEGGSLNLVLHNYAWTQEASCLGTAENMEGDLNLMGREEIIELDDRNNLISKEVVYSSLQAQDLIASERVIVNGIVRATGKVTSGTDMLVESGSLRAAKLTSGGNLIVGSLSENDATLIVDDTASVAGKVEVYGQAFGGDLTVAQGVEVHNSANSDAVLEADSITASYVTRELSVNTIVEGEDGSVTPGTESRNIRIGYNAAVDDAGVDSPILSDGVRISMDGISAGTIAANTVINISAEENSIVSATKMEGSELKIAGSTIMTNVRNDKGKVTFIADAYYGSIESEGELSADTLVLPDAYSLAAAKLEVRDGLETKVLSTTGTTEAKSIDIWDNVIYFDSIKSDTLVVGDGCWVNFSVAGDNGEVTVSEIEVVSATMGNDLVLFDTNVKGNLSVGTGAILCNISCEGELVTQDNATIVNTVITNTYKSHGTATLSNIRVADDATFGGARGDAFSSTGVCEDMVFSGVMTSTEEGSSLDITNLEVNVKNLTFSEAGEKHVLIEASEGNSCILSQPLEDISIVSASYTEVDVVSDGSTISIIGHRNEEAIKSALVEDSESRATALASLEYALATAADETVVNLHDMLGDVRSASVESRREILDAISGASLTALADSQRRGIQDIQSSLRNRIIQMGGSHETESAGIQAWAQAEGSFSTTDSSEEASGYDYNTWGATVGASFDLTENFILGLSFSASYGEIDADCADRATGNNDAYYVNFFARHQSNRWTQLFIFTVGTNDMDMERSVASYTASGSTSASSFSGYYELGYTLGLNDDFTHVLQPIISASITSAKIDGYTEEGTIGNAALEYDAANLVYGTVGFGFRYQGVLYETGFERSAVLELRAQVTQDFGDKTNEASVSMAGGMFNTVTGTDTTGTGYNLGAGLSLPIQMQTTFFADVDFTTRPDYTGVRANVGLRYDF